MRCEKQMCNFRLGGIVQCYLLLISWLNFDVIIVQMFGREREPGWQLRCVPLCTVLLLSSFDSNWMAKWNFFFLIFHWAKKREEDCLVCKLYASNMEITCNKWILKWISSQRLRQRLNEHMLYLWSFAICFEQHTPSMCCAFSVIFE